MFEGLRGHRGQSSDLAHRPRELTIMVDPQAGKDLGVIAKAGAAGICDLGRVK